MARILHRLPFFAQDGVVLVGNELVQVKAYEIVVWVSLASRPVLAEGPPRAFPAILDTGHTHNFAILEEHLIRWTGLRPSMLPVLGSARHQGRRLPVHAAHLWLHPNQPGQRDQLAARPAYRLHIPRGIIIYPAGTRYPRLPLLGLRAIARNKLRLTVDGERLRVSLRTPGWWHWLFG